MPPSGTKAPLRARIPVVCSAFGISARVHPSQTKPQTTANVPRVPEMGT